MADLSGAAILALTLWTVWVIVLLGVSWGFRWSLGYMALSLAVWVGTDVSWRGYLVGTLIVHLLIVAAIVSNRSRRRLGRNGWTAGVSAAGVVWLAATGGRLFWVPLVVVVSALVVAAIWVFALRCLRWSGRTRGGIGPHQPPVRPPPTTPPPSKEVNSPRPEGTVRPRLPRPVQPPTRPASNTSQMSGHSSDRTPRGLTAGYEPSIAAADADREATHRSDTPPVGDLYFAMPPADGVLAIERRQPYFVVAAESPETADQAPAKLTVVARTAGTVRVSGIATLCPAGKVRVRRSSTVVAGDDGVITLKRHIRIKQIELSLDELLERAAKAVADFVDGGSVDQFQRRLRSILGRHAQGDAEVRQEISTKHQVEVRECRYVHMGDRGQTDIDKRVVLERSVLPLHEMLIRDGSLCRLLREALREEEPGSATTEFLRRSLKMVARTGDDELIRAAGGSDTPDAQLHQLFGTARVRDAELVVVGANNSLRNDVRLRRPGFDAASLRSELDHVRPAREPVELIDQPPAVPPPVEVIPPWEKSEPINPDPSKGRDLDHPFSMW